MHDLKKDFIDAPELAQMLNRSLATVHAYRKTGKMPQPKAKLNTVYLWDRVEVSHWIAKENGLLKPCNDELYIVGGAK